MDHLQQISAKAHAKINLCLDVKSRRSDGYHELDTIFQRLDLHDTITLRRIGSGIRLSCAGEHLPVGPKNLVYRAALAIRAAYGVDYGVEIHLRKNIPVAAGLGGGSADAAAVLRELPALWRLPALPRERLGAIARALGADVPFFLGGVTARGRGIGDELEELPPFLGYEVLLVKPRARLSTAQVYADLRLAGIVHPDVDLVVKAMKEQDLPALGLCAGNVLQETARAIVPEIDRIGETLRGLGAPVVLMSGSGPTVFALHNAAGWAAQAADSLTGTDWTIIPTRTA